MGLRLFSDWVRAHTGSSFLCREKTEEKKTEKRREDSVKTCQGESTQGMTEVRKAPTLSCEVTSDFYFFLILDVSRKSWLAFSGGKTQWLQI